MLLLIYLIKNKEEMNIKGKIVLFGSPSSCKLTFFNRLTDSRKGITSKELGITRDRNYEIDIDLILNIH